MNLKKIRRFWRCQGRPNIQGPWVTFWHLSRECFILQVAKTFYNTETEIDLVSEEETLDMTHVVMKLVFDNEDFKQPSQETEKVLASRTYVLFTPSKFSLYVEFRIVPITTEPQKGHETFFSVAGNAIISRENAIIIARNSCPPPRAPYISPHMFKLVWLISQIVTLLYKYRPIL